jgi:hypothetical protein
VTAVSKHQTPAQMKIAVVGGNLLGCAVVLNLALVAEREDECHPDDSPSHITSVVLFEQAPTLGGNAFRSLPTEAAATVAIGSARVLNLAKGTFLRGLVDTVNGQRNAVRVGFLHRTFRIPGTGGVPRGTYNAAPLNHPWRDDRSGSVRSFGAWDWDFDAYTVRHSGFVFLEVLARLLSGDALRFPFLAGAVYAFLAAMQIESKLARAASLFSPLVLIAVTAIGPGNVLRKFNNSIAFWCSTLSLLYTHGMTVGVSRGATMGFIKHLETVRETNLATCALSVGQLVKRTHLDRYVRASASDFFEKFKYDPLYVSRYLTPVIDAAYPGVGAANVNAFAGHLALLQEDYANSDATDHYTTVAPTNATLCAALVDAAAVNLPVETRLEFRVTAIVFDERLQKYRITSTAYPLSSAPKTREEIYDGVVLCAHVNTDVIIGLANNVDAGELLRGEYGEAGNPEVNKSPSSHLAIVHGTIIPSFFGFSRDVDVPDIVRATNCPSFAQIERIPPNGRLGGISRVNGLRAGVGLYSVICSDSFQTGSLFSEMFDSRAEILHYGPRPPLWETVAPLSPSACIDDNVSMLLLGKRFVNAAATDRLARHPEMDAISAMNAASLFSHLVDWTDE